MKQNNNLVSVVIPNYNNSKFIVDCLDSITSQKYSRKEIIVVDDGSTDNSVDKIKAYIKSHEEENIKLIQQKNSGATVARNRGIEEAGGDYIIFIDSDDVLCHGILNMVMTSEFIKESDLIIGGYLEIDESGNKIGKKSFCNKKTMVSVKEFFANLIDIDPVPANKIYNLNIIKSYKMKWNNVKIGQDLDFYLRYLALCKKVTIVNDEIFQYRFTTGSISRSYDFRIFDIVTVFSNVKDFYAGHGMETYYNKYMPVQISKHFSYQLSKQIFFKNREDRKKVMEYFMENENKIGSEKERKKNHRKCIMKNIKTSNIYCAIFRGILTIKKKMKYILKPTRGEKVI